jgi:hypothetical protein
VVEQNSKVWRIRIRIPCSNGDVVWSYASEFNQTEEGAMLSLMGRFPDATAFIPLSWTKGVPELTFPATPAASPEMVVCKDCVMPDGPSYLSKWCRRCGQAPEEHPVIAGTRIGDAAENFIQGITWEGAYD